MINMQDIKVSKSLTNLEEGLKGMQVAKGVHQLFAEALG